MKLRGAQISMAVVCLVLGMMLAVQFRTQARNPVNLSGNRWSELTVQMENLQRERDDLAEEVISLRGQLKKTASHAEGTVLEAMNEELAKANMVAGLLPVKGPGIIVILNDSPRTLQQGEDPNLYIIHDEDLLKVINELKAAGAEAISVNGERIVANSEVRCAGPTILINVNKMVPPFEIRAIGDQDVLLSSLRIKGGILETLELWGVKAQIQKEELVEIPAFKGSVKFKYAQLDND